MAGCENKKNPLPRNGTSRTERLLPGLKEGYVNVDEKSIADWIVFAKDFAQYLKFYDANGFVNGDWAPFFNSDVSAVLGTFAIQNVDVYKRTIKERLDFLKDDDHVALINSAEKKLYELFSLIFSFCIALDHLNHLLPKGHTLKGRIENNIRQNLSHSVIRLLSYYKASQSGGFITVSDVKDLKVLGQNVKGANVILNGNGLGNLWWQHPSSPVLWEDYFNDLPGDDSIFGDATLILYFESLYPPTAPYTKPQWVQYMKMNHAANHNLFSGVFDNFLLAYSKIVSDAQRELLAGGQENHSHNPHYTLFLTFLNLYKYAQKDLNLITHRHLDFYYKDVLQIKKRTPLPNKAHIIAELAKPVTEHILFAGAEFKAGKDNEGKEVIYTLENETSFNKAKVAVLKSVYKGSVVDDNNDGSNTFNGRLFAAPVVNSDDGLGAELTGANKEWHPFANRIYVDGNVQEIKMPLAEIGFAIASHYLYLQEGERKVMLRLDTNNNDVLKNKPFKIYLTTEKEWYQVDEVEISVNNSFNKNTKSCVEFAFTLPGDAPAIVNYNTKVHSGTLGVNVPVAKVILDNDLTDAYEYNALQNIQLNAFEVAVSAGTTGSYNAEGLKQLLVTTDAGPANTSKPFQPFGAQPQTDATLVIGNKEIFTKQNTNVQINIQWANIPPLTNVAYDNPATTTTPTVNQNFLTGGVWRANDGSGSNQKTMGLQLFASGVQVATPLVSLPVTAIADYDKEYLPYDAKTVNGFLKLTLNSDFGYKKYLADLTLHLINSAKGTGTATAFGGVEPYLPVIKSIHLSYNSCSPVVNLKDSSADQFISKSGSLFHLYPFGDAEQHTYLTGNTVHYLLPQFQHTAENGTIVSHEGEFYIGFENLLPQQSVNVLFQVMDGTADPTISKPDKHLHWSYLANNQWQDFLQQEINDATAQFIQSGIISFIIPAEASITNSLLPAGYLWIRAAVQEKTGAVCKLLSVDAQAAKVVFENNNNASDFLDAALPAGSITKLKLPQSAVKSISQPYSSFGGRAAEAEEAYYTRVSERLRHKARAITIWDYEHLILEAFPSIHKVKCLNHTQSTDTIYNEVIPGHVTIITIPDLKQRNDVNPLKPYTSQAVLKSIESFLRARISCHVKLHVVNPVFEEVKLKFKLRLAKGFDDFTIYANRLREEITNFLSPWAYSSDADIDFGGEVHKSVLINFIEERSYVDFITDVELSHYVFDGSLVGADMEEVNATTARSILVSVPATQHEITEIPASVTNPVPECLTVQDE